MSRATRGGTARSGRAVPDRPGMVPLWLVRGATALLAVLLGAVVWNGSAWIVLPALLAVGAALLPSIGLASVTLLLLIVAYAVNMPAGSPWLLAFVAGLHALLVLYLLLVRLPLHGWISRSALVRIGVSFARVQILAQPLAVLALILGDAGSSLVVVVAGVVAVIGWALWLVSRRRTERR
ncbi:hypothetical protein FJV46_11175 [Arthrobacter agilis]|uniref:hypothetical protein n=1 Tax=Arthrobacter agilis TaxID=37921 RepID=UPI000B364584|nr:hypothetical protein [Arthrobacter agilis]OUM44072.1 hypothetical protein B8W74_04115 [Arthrobacter agilis]PPB46448.1 hypothetical protein CI784_06405 [Arthrobacter agilis]TPV23897.1 hypothetical protein FJV46_11175 [Arthrobacter agilis]VDR32643.1 Uncharacterised protein [Arthrobacter agilis]